MRTFLFLALTLTLSACADRPNDDTGASSGYVVGTPGSSTIGQNDTDTGGGNADTDDTDATGDTDDSGSEDTDTGTGTDTDSGNADTDDTDATGDTDDSGSEDTDTGTGTDTDSGTGSEDTDTGTGGGIASTCADLHLEWDTHGESDVYVFNRSTWDMGNWIDVGDPLETGDGEVDIDLSDLDLGFTPGNTLQINGYAGGGRYLVESSTLGGSHFTVAELCGVDILDYCSYVSNGVGGGDLWCEDYEDAE